MVAEDGKIKSIKLFEQLKGQYLIYFSVNLLQKIFYDEEFYQCWNAQGISSIMWEALLRNPCWNIL